MNDLGAIVLSSETLRKKRKFDGETSCEGFRDVPQVGHPTAAWLREGNKTLDTGQKVSVLKTDV